MKIKAFTKSFRVDSPGGEYERPEHNPVPSRAVRVFWALLTSFWASGMLQDRADLFDGWVEPIGIVAALALAIFAWMTAFAPRETLLKWRRQYIASLLALFAVWVLAVLA